MKKLWSTWLIIAIIFLTGPKVFAAGGIYASGGGTKTEGEVFNISIVASGVQFDSLQGTISVSGNVTVVSVSGGGATWLPGKSPAAGKEFIGITSPTSSLTVATVRLKATKPGSGAVSVTNAKLARSGSIVSTSSGGTSIKINRALVPAGNVTVTSTSHPDQNANYEAKEIALSWDKPNNASEFSYVLDQVADTTPEAKTLTTDTSAVLTVEHIGTYYFHIRAKNADGWGGSTHFKINIISATDESLAKPIISSIEKSDVWQMDLEQGTVTGVLLKGTGLSGHKLKLTLEPAVEGLVLETVIGTAPADAEKIDANSENAQEGSEGEQTPAPESVTPSPETTEPIPSPTITATPEATGEVVAWQIITEQPLKAGFYKLTAQSEYNETLTPVSEVVRFEISLAKGGSINIITDADLKAPEPQKTIVLGIDITKHPLRWTAILTAILMILLFGATYFGKKLIQKKLAKKPNKNIPFN